MKLPKVHLLVAFTTLALGSPSPSAEGRTIQDINIIPARVLKRAITDKYYRSVLMSPVRSWVTVRGQLVGTQVTNLKVVRSEPNHANDQLALQRAREVQIAGAYTVERPITP